MQTSLDVVVQHVADALHVQPARGDVRGDQDVRLQQLRLVLAESAQAGGARFLAHLDQQLHVEAEAPVAGRTGGRYRIVA